MNEPDPAAAPRPAAPEFAETGRQTLSAGRFISLCRIDWRGPDGQERTWESAERTNCAGAVLVIARWRPGGDYLLIRQYRPPARGKVLEFPAGLIERGEEPAAAARRELREETGYRATIENCYPAAFTSPGLSGEAVHVALAVIDGDAPENRAPRAAPDAGEFIETLRVAPGEALGLIAAEAAAGRHCDSKVLTYFIGRASRRET